ncbi:histidine-type phosphatase [Streptomyces sp. NPDC088146]|uniref:histidine-type phosphatase n=1 Tax=Streptomyces sp. NPDC088146 TaxID=3365829 RepID=UPI0037F98B46
MKRLASTAALALVVSAVLGVSQPAQAGPRPSGPPGPGFYSTKTPYEPRQDARTYRSAPKGFVPVFTESVSRHGSRTSTSSEDGDLILQLWDKAASEGELTGRGKHFGPEVRSLLDAMEKAGYGNLSGRGKREIQATAVRMHQRLPGLFRQIAKDSEPIDVVSSGKDRAVDSGSLFAAALAGADPALKPLIGPARTDKDLLYFHKADGGAAYRDYLANDQRLAATLKKITDQPATHRAARNVLERIFTPAFVQRISAGEFSSIGTGIDAAEAVYNLYSIAPTMSDEGTWRMRRYIAPRDAAWFAYLGDAEDFYEKGPGFADSDITYRMADVLLDDFFEQAEATRAGTGDVGAELRFTHAEEIIPLAALMGLPGSTKPAAARPYAYADNPWRGASVAPMAANIQWDVFRKDDTYLVRMLYNEKETAFKRGCEPVAKGSPFYDLDELRRCFGRTAS